MIETFATLSIMFHNQFGDHLPQQAWTKYGGGSYGLLKESLSEWYCQICGEKQVKVLPSYMIPIDDSQRDFIRVCSKCKAETPHNKVVFSFQLLKIIKKI